MATARSTMRTRLLYKAANRSDLTNAQLDEWLNAGLMDLCSRIRVRQMETRDISKTFTLASNTLTFPTNMIAILHIRNSSTDQPLERIAWPAYRLIRVVSGTPRLWTVFGTTVYFDKLATTTDSLDIFGYNQPSWAAGDAATPGIDDQLEYGIELLAAAHMFRDTDNEAKAAVIENPAQPGAGTFWNWVRSNRLPTLTAGTAARSNAAIRVRTEGYEGL